MSGDVLVAVGCGFVVGAIAWIHDHVKIQRFIRAFQHLQRSLVTPVHFTEVADTESHPLFAHITQDQTDEVARHGVKLGDIVMSYDGTPGALRVFVDEAKTTLIYIITVDSSTDISVESYTDETELQTRRSKTSSWVRPPFHILQMISPQASVRDLVDAHHELVKTANGPLLRFDSAADAIRAWVQIQQRSIAWRAAQPPDELLEQDLRMLIGPGYKRLSPRLRTKLRAPIPKATVRSTRL